MHKALKMDIIYVNDGSSDFEYQRLKLYFFQCIFILFIDNSFYNFPISNVLKEIYKSFRRAHQDWYLGTVAFRLASQETRYVNKKVGEGDVRYPQYEVISPATEIMLSLIMC